ncbi:MAG: NAD(P)/FAD-dependent oxidoreductase [Limnochordia bacterium]|jgi:predicted Rossmann fold flavoprotein
MGKVVVVGAGAAGLMAAGSAAEMGSQVLLLEKMGEPGRKLQIAGKGRCNLTNAGELEELIAGYPGNGSFLYSALARFNNHDLIEFFHALGVPTKVERGRRVFPRSDDAQQVVDALRRWVENLGVEIEYHCPVRELIVEGGQMVGVRTDGGEVLASRVILATGGSSYPGTGSTGDGYRMAQAVGHRVIPLRPALVPLRASTPWVRGLQGLSLRNVQVTLRAGQRILASQFGEMLFTHFGVSGPIVLTISREALDYWLQSPGRVLDLLIDLKPALDRETLDRRVQRDLQKHGRKQLNNSLDDLLPKALIPVIIEEAGLNPRKTANQVNREERARLVSVLKELPVEITGSLPLAAAIVTAGGVCVREVDPRRMESKLISGLYFAGEVLDIDGITGGYNLQAAFSTGRLAGWSAGGM